MYRYKEFQSSGEKNFNVWIIWGIQKLKKIYLLKTIGCWRLLFQLQPTNLCKMPLTWSGACILSPSECKCNV